MSVFNEVIGINAFYEIRLRSADANVEVDHQLGKTQTVNEHNFGFNRPDVVVSVTGERTRCQEYALAK